MGLKYGVIGVGRMGIRHIEAILRIPEIELIGIYDTQEKLAREISAQYKIHSFSTLDDLVQSKEIEAVSICTPNHLHKIPTIECLQNGKHVLLEKPLATTIADCDAIICAANQSHMKLMMGHTHRFYPIHQQAKKIIQSGKIGSLKIVSLTGMYPGFFPKVNLPPDWIKQKESLPGTFMLDAIHYVDLLQWWFDDEISEICPLSSVSLNPDPTIENIGCFSVKLKKGGCGQILCNNATPGISLSKFILIFDKGVIESDFSPSLMYGTENWQKCPINYEKIPGKPDMYAHNLQGFINEIRAFYNSIRDNQDVPISGEQGKRNVQLILTLYEKIKS